MKKESEIFKYQKGKKIGEIFIIVLILTLISFVLNSDGSGITKLLLTVPMSAFIILIIFYSYLLNENIQIDSETLTLNKKIGKSNHIKFNNIQKVTIRDEEKIGFGLTCLKMTIFESNKYTNLIVSDLEKQLQIISLIEEKGQKFGFNVIHQDLDGNLVSSLKDKAENKNS